MARAPLAVVGADLGLWPRRNRPRFGLRNVDVEPGVGEIGDDHEAPPAGGSSPGSAIFAVTIPATGPRITASRSFCWSCAMRASAAGEPGPAASISSARKPACSLRSCSRAASRAPPRRRAASARRRATSRCPSPRRAAPPCARDPSGPRRGRPRPGRPGPRPAAMSSSSGAGQAQPQGGVGLGALGLGRGQRELDVGGVDPGQDLADLDGVALVDRPRLEGATHLGRDRHLGRLDVARGDDQRRVDLALAAGDEDRE